MPRVKRGMGHVKHRKNLMKRVKGFEAGRKNLIKQAKVADLKAGVHAYRDRRVKKRDMRALFQIRINAAVRPMGMSYSKFMNALKLKNISLNRKVLSEIAKGYPDVFKKVFEAAQ
ncbi:MAG: 50S ribosomal protein L20 [Candidatus Magasanikbacteria bacterium RIFCSPHIGHO2_02_FULL_41_13]|uniref:Large ribosomal subunit protein bL20 n=1 Tax=Candidatus Magasanikbacteria bacterium RIFCSPHIGHO2_02_FULL_41_13 TaxID=1798676 RepID=A0A1F6M400_9BACT|nr:MAG: 50S ribosomal protein L20 [Candidatus Magasanikbacteria bacterium RIFCSPHIGHO2_02_FULL_41_13]